MAIKRDAALWGDTWISFPILYFLLSIKGSRFLFPFLFFPTYCAGSDHLGPIPLPDSGPALETLWSGMVGCHGKDGLLSHFPLSCGIASPGMLAWLNLWWHSGARWSWSCWGAGGGGFNYFLLTCSVIQSLLFTSLRSFNCFNWLTFYLLNYGVCELFYLLVSYIELIFGKMK